MTVASGRQGGREALQHIATADRQDVFARPGDRKAFADVIASAGVYFNAALQTCHRSSHGDNDGGGRCCLCSLSLHPRAFSAVTSAPA